MQELYKPRSTRDAPKPLEAQRQAWSRSSLTGSRGNNPVGAETADFRPPERWETQSALFGAPPAGGPLLQQPKQTNTSSGTVCPHAPPSPTASSHALDRKSVV